MQFYYKRETTDGLTSGILDVTCLDSFAEQLEEFLEESPNGEVIFTGVDKAGTFDPEVLEDSELEDAYQEILPESACPLDGTSVSSWKCVHGSNPDLTGKGRCPFFSHAIIGAICCRYMGDGIEITE